ncbi:hypothetical protein BH09ACT5_BH09ACT5_07830 [soil metagenome]
MALTSDTPERQDSDAASPDESDDRMFTDSFAPRDPALGTEPEPEEDELDEIEDLMPKGGPTEGTAPLP